jgi:hypothetical protein
MFSVEIRVLEWQLKSCGEERIKLGKDRARPDEGLEETGFVANHVHARNFVDTLVGRNISELIVGKKAIPPYEEGFRVVGGLGTLKTLKSFTDNRRADFVDVNLVIWRQHDGMRR